MARMHQAFLPKCGIINQLTKNKKERESEMANNNERTIVTTIVNDAISMGYYINIDNGGDSLELESPTKNFNLIMDTLFAAGEEVIKFYEFNKESKKYNRIGGVYLVYGNGSGCDVISDYNCNLKMEKILHNAERIAHKLSLL